MSRTLIIELPEEVVEQAVTPEGMARARAAILAEFGPLDPKMLEAAHEGIEDMQAGRSLPIDEARAASLTAFEERLKAERQQTR